MRGAKRALGAVLVLAVAVAITTADTTVGTFGRPDNLDSLAGWDTYDSAGHNGSGLRRPSQVQVSDGIMTITGTADGTTGGVARTGHTQRYGQWDVRMRAPAGCRCYHPVVLLWGEGGGSGVNNPNGEIDIVEVFRDATRQRNTFSVHYGDGSQSVGDGIDVDLTQWHVYHFAWRAGALWTWIDDGSPYFENTDTAVLPTVAMDLAIQLDWFPAEGSSGGDTATMQVDYVRQSVTTTRSAP